MPIARSRVMSGEDFGLAGGDARGGPRAKDGKVSARARPNRVRMRGDALESLRER